MRPAETYRGARRNRARDEKRLHAWKTSKTCPAAVANGKAKIAERRAACLAARTCVAIFVKTAPATATNHDIFSVLREFWSKQPRSRVNYRILKELGAALHSKQAQTA